MAGKPRGLRLPEHLEREIEREKERRAFLLGGGRRSAAGVGVDAPGTGGRLLSASYYALPPLCATVTRALRIYARRVRRENRPTFRAQALAALSSRASSPTRSSWRGRWGGPEQVCSAGYAQSGVNYYFCGGSRPEMPERTAPYDSSCGQWINEEGRS